MWTVALYSILTGQSKHCAAKQIFNFEHVSHRVCVHWIESKYRWFGSLADRFVRIRGEISYKRCSLEEEALIR